MNLRSFLMLLQLAAPAMGQDALVVTSKGVDARYCIGPKGGIELSLTTEFTYRNVGAGRVALLIFRKLSGVSFFLDDAHFRADEPALRLKLRLKDFVRTQLLDPSKPRPGYFQVVPPGADAGLKCEIRIPPGIPGSDLSTLFGKSILVQFNIDNWPGHKHIEAWRPIWQPLGTLWAGEDTTPPVILELDGNPKPTRCYPRVD
jgi:hypothetical protein